MAKSKKTDVQKPVWLKYTDKEVKAIILKLAEKGLTTEKIGLTLRDQYGIPKTKIYGIKIGEVLREKGKFQEPTLINLEKRKEKVENHYKKNKQDKKAERSLTIIKARLKKTNEYLNRKKE